MNRLNFLVTNILVFGAVVAILLLRWIRKRPKESQWVVSYPIFVQILSVVGLFFVFTGVSMLAELSPGWVAKMFVLILSAPAGVLVFMAAAEVFASETAYNESALYRSTPWRQFFTVSFDEVVRIENSPLRYQCAIHARDGQIIKVCKWTDRWEDVLAYAEEGLEVRNDLSPDLEQDHNLVK
jgi:hypothetical protein